MVLRYYEKKIIEHPFKEKILNHSVRTCEKHFKANASLWVQWVRESCRCRRLFDVSLLL